MKKDVKRFLHDSVLVDKCSVSLSSAFSFIPSQRRFWNWTYRNPGTAVTCDPSCNNQSTCGLGEPCDEQLTCDPVALENIKLAGGSNTKTGPCSTCRMVYSIHSETKRKMGYVRELKGSTSIDCAKGNFAKNTV